MRQPDLDMLKKAPLFGGLDECALNIFAENAQEIHVAKGGAVFLEGETAASFYMIESGRLAVDKECPAGPKTILYLLGGACFGEQSFIDMQPRAATVRAEEDCVLWRWPYALLRRSYCTDAKCYTMLVMNIAREISRRLRRADAWIVDNTCQLQKASNTDGEISVANAVYPDYRGV